MGKYWKNLYKNAKCLLDGVGVQEDFFCHDDFVSFIVNIMYLLI